MSLKETLSSAEYEMVEKCRGYVKKNIKFRQTNKVQYGHPSPYYWFETDVPVDSILEKIGRAHV
jgi:hypothetical protein